MKDLHLALLFAGSFAIACVLAAIISTGKPCKKWVPMWNHTIKNTIPVCVES